MNNEYADELPVVLESKLFDSQVIFGSPVPSEIVKIDQVECIKLLMSLNSRNDRRGTTLTK